MYIGSIVDNGDNPAPIREQKIVAFGKCSHYMGAIDT
jgi:hypothetical protein